MTKFNIIDESLNREQKNWIKQKIKDMNIDWKNIHKDWFGGKYRIYLPISISEEDKLQPIPEIKDYIEKKGYVITDYLGNKAIKKDRKGEFKIGKLLSDNTVLLSKYIKHKTNVSNVEDMLLCISRLPTDYAAQSTGQSWTSCKDFESKYQNYRWMGEEIKEGWLIAYVIRETDKLLKHPLGRILAVPYYNGKNTYYKIFEPTGSSKMGNYGSNVNTEARRLFREWLDGKQSDYDPTTEYKWQSKGYQDSFPSKLSNIPVDLNLTQSMYDSIPTNKLRDYINEFSDTLNNMVNKDIIDDDEYELVITNIDKILQKESDNERIFVLLNSKYDIGNFAKKIFIHKLLDSEYDILKVIYNNNNMEAYITTLVQSTMINILDDTHKEMLYTNLSMIINSIDSHKWNIKVNETIKLPTYITELLKKKQVDFDNIEFDKLYNLLKTEPNKFNNNMSILLQKIEDTSSMSSRSEMIIDIYRKYLSDGKPFIISRMFGNSTNELNEIAYNILSQDEYSLFCLYYYTKFKSILDVDIIQSITNKYIDPVKEMFVTHLSSDEFCIITFYNKSFWVYYKTIFDGSLSNLITHKKELLVDIANKVNDIEDRQSFIYSIDRWFNTIKVLL